jgi:hypothetical protein
MEIARNPSREGTRCLNLFIVVTIDSLKVGVYQNPASVVRKRKNGDEGSRATRVVFYGIGSHKRATSSRAC